MKNYTIIEVYKVETPPESIDLPCTNAHIVSPDGIHNFIFNADVTLLICTVFSAMLQIYIMFNAVKHIRRRTSDKCMHVFLLSMTLADFILTAICYPAEFVDRIFAAYHTSNTMFPKYINVTIHMLTWIGLIVSSLSLVFLNLDKLFYFRFPLRYSCFFTRTLSIFIVCTLWLFSSVFIGFAWLLGAFNCPFEDDGCKTLVIFDRNWLFYIAFVCLVSIIPTLTSLGVSIYIMKIVSEHRRQLAEEQALCQPATPGRSNSNTMIRTRMRTFYLIFMMTIFTAITLLPYRLISIHRITETPSKKDCLTIIIFWVMMYMVYLNSIVNPLLTVTVLPQYRIKCITNFFFQTHEQLQNGYHTTTTTITANGIHEVKRTSL